MNLNRRGFLRATGLTGLLAALGTKLPEVEVTEELPVIVPAVVSSDCGIIAPIPAPQLPLVDLSSLRNVSIEVSRPIDMLYHWDGSSLPAHRGEPRWEASVLMQPDQFDAIGLSPDELMVAKYRYRFALPFEERYFEGDGIVIELQPRGCGGVMWEDPIAMTIQGTRPLWVHL